MQKLPVDLKTATLGIELGSTRIKAVLLGRDNSIIATGSFRWDNQLINGYWSYAMEDVWRGIQECFRQIAKNVEKSYGEKLTQIGAIGFSAMMHGYLPFNKAGNLLVPFRTWRNTSAAKAAEILTRELQFNIPLRWSLAHLYQAIIDQEAHVAEIDYITTLSGYVHWKLTGKRVLGVGDASGMFPVSQDGTCYDPCMLKRFNALIQPYHFPWKTEMILPQIVAAGECAGYLTPEGAQLIDPSGTLRPGIPFCAPEGDAGTGMVATNSVAVNTGNISAGTSVFLMAVLEHPLAAVHKEIDMVATPSGKHVAMVHCNNCTNEINAWANVFEDFSTKAGMPVRAENVFDAMFKAALTGKEDAGGIISYNYLSGEPLANVDDGALMLVRSPKALLSFSNLMRSLLYSAVASLTFGMEILKEENIELREVLGHGGFFKTAEVGARIVASAIGVPVATQKAAEDGGPFGMAALAKYMIGHEANESLEDFLNRSVFNDAEKHVVDPDPITQRGFEQFLSLYRQMLPIERQAGKELSKP